MFLIVQRKVFRASSRACGSMEENAMKCRMAWEQA